MSLKTDKEILQLGRATVKKEAAVAASLENQLTQTFVEACKLIVDCAGHVVLTGAGTSHAVALRFAHLLSCCGTPAFFLHPGDSQHGASGALRKGDVLIALSKGGETREVNFLASYAKDNGVAVIGICERADSTLGQLSTVVLEVIAPEDSDPYGMIATGSSLFNSALGDAICVTVLKMRGYTEEAFSKTHPGGAVGIRIDKNKPKK